MSAKVVGGRKVVKLSEEVANRIAAGEVIERPACAVKELLENSMDAGATTIQFTFKDDGDGILRDDLHCVCERHTTSKLKNWEDLKEIATFGFRGEALASMSHVAHVSIQSMPQGQPCAFKCQYQDGKALGAPKPIAGRKGTTITIEDLFYNVPTKRKSITNVNDEGKKIVEVLKHYAIDNPKISFSCKKFGESLSEFSTPKGGDVISVVRTLNIESSAAESLLPVERQSDALDYTMSGYASNNEFSGTKRRFVLFINKRLVACSSLKRAIAEAYTVNGSKLNFFVYLSLKIKPQNVDVNVDPKKATVAFLNEDKIIREIVDAIVSVVQPKGAMHKSHNMSDIRDYSTAADFNPGGPKRTSTMNNTFVDDEGDDASQRQSTSNTFHSNHSPFSLKQSTPTNKTQKKQSQNTPHKSMLDDDMDVAARDEDFQAKKEATRKKRNAENPLESDFTPKRKKKDNNSDLELTSIQNLITSVSREEDQKLVNILCCHRYVGMLDGEHCMIQHDSGLYIINIVSISKEYMYLVSLLNFGKFRSYSLSPNPSMFALIMISLDSSEAGWAPEDGDKGDIARAMLDLLLQKREMLREYFMIDFSEHGELCRLPLLLEGYLPPMHRLPSFLFNMASMVNWDEEQECFDGVCRCLASLNAMGTDREEDVTAPSQSIQTPMITTASTPTKEVQTQVKYPQTFQKRDKEDHPMNRALEFSVVHPEAYLWAKPYGTFGSARYYIAQPVQDFYQDYLDMVAADRQYHDIVRESYPVKLYIDVEWDPKKEEEVDDMMSALKGYVGKQWEEDTGLTYPRERWIEYDASLKGKKVSRHLHNDGMVFYDSIHLYTFMKRLIKTISTQVRNDVEDAKKLIIYRPSGKDGNVRKELVMDMKVYNRNNCLRLPGSVTGGDVMRPLYLVEDNGVIRRDMAVPDFDTFIRTLSTYWPKGTPPVEPHKYPNELLEERKGALPISVLSPQRRLDIEKTTYQLIVEGCFFAELRKEVQPSKELAGSRGQEVAVFLSKEALYAGGFYSCSSHGSLNELTCATLDFTPQQQLRGTTATHGGFSWGKQTYPINTPRVLYSTSADSSTTVAGDSYRIVLPKELVTSEYLVESKLYQGNRSQVFAVRAKEGKQMVVKVPFKISKSIIEKYSKEVEFDNKLKQNVYLCKDMKLQDKKILVMNRFCGQSIQDLLEHTSHFSLTEFLHVALLIVKVLSSLHQSNIFHQQLHPSHVLYSRTEKKVTFVDFSLATTLNRIQANRVSASAFSGSYHYISPEQTGRINRDVDYRTDYYSLGVLFYQMLSGSLPFDEQDQAKLLYDHIAREATPLHGISAQIPKGLSDIVSKLLAKSPDDRYQSCHGIRMDLEFCVEQLKEGNTSAATFIVGQHDFRPVFQIPRKIYGREKEKNLLTELFEEVTSKKVNSHVIVISGLSGTGKTLLINEVQKPLSRCAGYFISGKMDQFGKQAPYTAVIQAFQQLIHCILTENEERIDWWRGKLISGLRGRGRLMVDAIPDLVHIIGSQPQLPTLGPVENQTRFRSVFFDFVTVFACVEHPLVLLLEDIQWMDLSTITLLDSLMNHPQLRNIFIVTTVRSDEISNNQPLVDLLDKHDEGFTRIHLSELTKENVTEMLADALECSREKTLSLAEIAIMRTKGNPFFLHIYLDTLATHNYITRDTDSGKWTWDVEKILGMNTSTDVVTALTERYKKMSLTLREILSKAACVGNLFTLDYLSAVTCLSVTELSETLVPCVRDNILLVDSDITTGKIDGDFQLRFAHDRIQQAAYEAMPEELRILMHLEMAKLLMRENAEDKLFDVVHHLIKSGGLIQQIDEIEEIPELCLRAGERAKTASSFSHGLEAAKLGLQTLKPSDWDQRYRLAFDLHMLEAECTFMCNGNASADDMFKALLPRSQNSIDTASIYFAWAVRYEWQQMHPECVDVLRQFLNTMGIQFPDHSSPNEDYMTHAAQAYERVKESLKGRELNDLIDVPYVSSVDEENCMRAFALMWSSLYLLAKPFYMTLVTLLGVQYAIEHGNSAYSGMLYLNYTSNFILMTEDLSWVSQISEVGFTISERYVEKRMRCRALFGYSWPSWKTKSIRLALPYLSESYHSADDHGDIPFAVYASSNIPLFSWYAGVSLDAQWNTYLQIEEYLLTNNVMIHKHTQGLMYCVREHIRQNDRFAKQEAQWLSENSANFFVMAGYAMGKLLHTFWQPSTHLQITEAIDRYLLYRIILGGYYAYTECNFVCHLLLLSLKRSGSLDFVDAAKLQTYRQLMEDNLKSLEKAAEWSPANNLHKLHILQGEIARTNHNMMEACRQYSMASASAKEYGFVQYQAMANELTAIVLKEQGIHAAVSGPAREAFRLYKHWGSITRSEMMSELFQEHNVEIYIESPSHVSWEEQINNQTDALDHQTMQRVSEAITMDMSQEQLLSTMMKEIIINSGAERGIFLMNLPEGLVMVCEGSHDRVKVSTGGDKIPDSYPQCVINFVNRTRAPLLSRDIRDHIEFTSDPSLSEGKIVSVLCAPVLKKDGVKAIIYLENNLSTGIFTPKRLKVILPFTVQMAVHLESFRFTQMLEKETSELRITRASMEEFVDMLCHELRNPLNGIFGSKQLMEEELSHLKDLLTQNNFNVNEATKSIEEQTELVKAISISADHLKNVVDTVLTVSALERTGVSLESVAFDPADIIEKLELMFKARMTGMGLMATRDVPKEKCIVMGDPHRLLQFVSDVSIQVLVNVYSNSIKFVERGGIHIQYTYEPSTDNQVTLHFDIRDTGIGMTPDELKKLFKPFSQANDDIGRKYGGTGLGLSIVKELVHVMNGVIKIESEKDVGTSCHIAIKCSRASSSNKRKNEDAESTEEHPNKVVRTTSSPDLGMILVVDDSAINVKLMQRILNSEGLSSETADNGKEAFDKVSKSLSEGKPF
ncbi:putative ATPase [Planoprotostelium fungivorum]|uniref:Putative ATPase n=1 Tax=Planoprotostelium fungivorum TaxID=1890364 RepID=A0A2P6N4J2_9EUKA|nr:putative ATPase [Planoprotostelium fungivorum]